VRLLRLAARKWAKICRFPAKAIWAARLQDRAETAVDGRTLTLKYKDGEKKIFVPADTPIVIYEAGDKSDLKPGAKVFIVAAKQADSTLQGRAWRVGRAGVTPPM
jgi:hypothetical protein